MSVDRVNYLNIMLMLLACALAYYFPFHLLLFSYAFLGPAHYLTEISWLHDRRYFSRQRYGYLILLILAAPIAYFAGDRSLGAVCLWLALAAAYMMAFFDHQPVRSLIILCVALLAANLENIGLTNFLYVFVPTLIHVFVFTGAFILLGALKSKSISGYFSLMVFIICALSFCVVSPQELSPGVLNTPGFHIWSNLQQEIINRLNLEASPGTASAVMGFMSYAYTYHYLNWFSKTSVIKWHEIPAQRAISIVAIYFFSISLYLFDYTLGYMVLLFLSTLHVVLELPLNFISFRQIGHEIRSAASGGGV